MKTKLFRTEATNHIYGCALGYDVQVDGRHVAQVARDILGRRGSWVVRIEDINHLPSGHGEQIRGGTREQAVARVQAWLEQASLPVEA